jgi:DNA-binding response OmpR family regulator
MPGNDLAGEAPFAEGFQTFVLMITKGNTNFASPDVSDDGCLRVEHDKYYVACADRPLYNLTIKEFLILSRLAREIGRPVPQRALWASGWGENAEFDNSAARIIRVHISTLRHKLKPFGLHIISKPGLGYVLSTTDCVCPARNAQSSGVNS